MYVRQILRILRTLLCFALLVIDQIHNPIMHRPISHNVPFPYLIMHHFIIEICTCVYISVTNLCIVGYLSCALWDLWDGSITCWYIDPLYHYVEIRHTRITKPPRSTSIKPINIDYILHKPRRDHFRALRKLLRRLGNWVIALVSIWYQIKCQKIPRSLTSAKCKNN